MSAIRRRTGLRVQAAGVVGIISFLAVWLGAASCTRGGDTEKVHEEAVQTGFAEPSPSPAPPMAMDRGMDRAGGMTGSGAVAGGSSAREVQQSAPQSAPQSEMPTTMLIRTGEVALEVDSVEAGVTAVEGLAARAGGYVATVAVQGGERQYRSARIEIRVPAQRFDDVVGGLGPLGKVLSVSVHSQDVGEEFVDVTARLSNARRLEERLLALLATRTGRLEDVLAVERELARVRGEIERYEGRLRYLRNRAEMSSLAVILQQQRPLLARQPGINPIREAFGAAWRNFVGFVALLIEAMGVVVPLAVLALAAFLVWRRFRRRFRWRKPDQDAGEMA